MAYLSIFYIAIVFMFSFGYRQNQPHALIKLSSKGNYINTYYVAGKYSTHGSINLTKSYAPFPRPKSDIVLLT